MLYGVFPFTCLLGWKAVASKWYDVESCYDTGILLMLRLWFALNNTRGVDAIPLAWLRMGLFLCLCISANQELEYASPEEHGTL